MMFSSWVSLSIWISFWPNFVLLDVSANILKLIVSSCNISEQIATVVMRIHFGFLQLMLQSCGVARKRADDAFGDKLANWAP